MDRRTDDEVEPEPYRAHAFDKARQSHIRDWLIRTERAKV
jgi:hypothetical protein